MGHGAVAGINDDFWCSEKSLGVVESAMCEKPNAAKTSESSLLHRLKVEGIVQLVALSTDAAAYLWDCIYILLVCGNSDRRTRLSSAHRPRGGRGGNSFGGGRNRNQCVARRP